MEVHDSQKWPSMTTYNKVPNFLGRSEKGIKYDVKD